MRLKYRIRKAMHRPIRYRRPAPRVIRARRRGRPVRYRSYRK